MLGESVQHTQPTPEARRFDQDLRLVERADESRLGEPVHSRSFGELVIIEQALCFGGVGAPVRIKQLCIGGDHRTDPDADGDPDFRAVFDWGETIPLRDDQLAEHAGCFGVAPLRREGHRSLDGFNRNRRISEVHRVGRGGGSAPLREGGLGQDRIGRQREDESELSNGRVQRWAPILIRENGYGRLGIYRKITLVLNTRE